MGGQFANKAILVTGAGSGMGKATARRFAQEGGRICAADLSQDGAERTAQIIRNSGGEAFACGVDIADPAGNDRMVSETVARYGRLDIAHLNAGYQGPVVEFFESELADFDRIIGVNLRGC